MESSESLARRILSRSYSSWRCSEYSRRVLSLAAGQSAVLDSAATFIIEADSVAQVTMSWTVSGVTTTLALSGLAVISPGASVTLTNIASVGTNAVPVAVTAFT